jgi:sulfonate transport system ATP-binding protein
MFGNEAAAVRVENLTKVYETGNAGNAGNSENSEKNSLSLTALRNVSLELPAGAFAALLGKSGCGKTTLLRLKAGLEEPSSGAVSCSFPRRHMGCVFQEARLMPWLSVADNIRFAEMGRKKVAGEDAPFGDVGEILRTLGLPGFANAFPHELSGGMAQRVALGRTLFCKPSLIVMDEPFGALDWFTRKSLQADLLSLWMKGGKTILFVTHDIDEALFLADRVFVMRDGAVTGAFRVEQPHPRDAPCPSLRRQILSSIENGLPQ